MLQPSSLMPGVSPIDDLMSTHSSYNWPFVFNLANSIIGVAVLALPFCFKEVFRLFKSIAFLALELRAQYFGSDTN